MKKLFCVLVAVCLIPVCVCAEYAGKTDDELKADFKTIVAELVTRGIWVSDTIPAGLYIVGQSIPAGTYEFTPVEYDTVSIYPTVEDMATGYNRILYLIFDENETFTLTLSEGMVVNLGSTCAIKPFGFGW